MTNITEKLLPDLMHGGRTATELPHGGYLVLEHDVPFLIIYRKRPDDSATERLAKTGSSYLLFDSEELDYYRDLITQLSRKMSARFGSFILLEMYKGASESREFKIQGPAHKLPATLDTLADALTKIEHRNYDLQLSASIEQTKERQADSSQMLFKVEALKAMGSTLLGLEIPPVYCDENGNAHPEYFKEFRERVTEAIKQAIFEFIRVQTSCKIRSFHSLGKREIHREVLKIDRQITAIQNKYEFLLLLAPVNIQALKARFFETGFEEIGSYRYRLLNVDPDLLKRELYNLRIDEIDDPALAYLYNEKREEIDQELTMLKERGSKNFFYSSIRLYKDIPQQILTEAKLILQTIPEKEDDFNEDLMDVYDFEKLAQKEFDFFRKQDPDFTGKVHIRPDVNIMMVSRGELYLPSDYKLTKLEARCLIQHELGTHALTFYNGSKQQLSQLSAGFADYDSTQEGIAVLSEYLAGGLCGNRLRILAGRVVAGADLQQGADFKFVFNRLYNEYGFNKERAFNITSRMFQGGGFMKDIIYLKGLVQVREYLGKGGELKPLLAGKYATRHVNIIKDLTDRELLKPPHLIPRYFENENFESKLKTFKEGIPLSDMVSDDS